MRWLTLLLALSLSAPFAAEALELTLPSSARQTAGEELGLDSYALPIGNFADGTLPTRSFEGIVVRQAWRIDGVGVTPLQVLKPLRDQLKSNDFESIFECASLECGGFDYRFSTDVIDAPDMLVDLEEFRVLSALKGGSDTPTEAINLLVSRSGEAIYLQLIRVSTQAASQIAVTRGDAVTGTRDASGSAETTQPSLTASQFALAQLGIQLRDTGHVILSDLEFATGSADLDDGPFNSLAELAAFLADDAERAVALVGHTDAVGGLDGNIALSKRRADSVRRRLINVHSVKPEQLIAQGVGFLSPVASNASDSGRKLNRRVEAVLISGR